MNRIYKYYHYPTAKELYFNCELNASEDLVRAFLKNGIELESLMDFYCEELAEKQHNESEKTEYPFKLKEFINWAEKRALSFILQCEQIEISRIKIISLTK